MESNVLSSGTQRQSQVSEQLEILEKSVNDVSHNIDVLSDRLRIVLREKEPPPPGKEKTEADENIVPVAASIRESRYYLEKSSNRLMDLVDRLEL